jgi:AraC family transcriptional regulator of adaptative response/methylated-DNA-[protein]-cysteine methyltransferase
LAVANDEGLFMLEFVDRRGLENEIKWLRKKTKSPIVPGNNVILEKIEAELASYFEGENLSFSVPILMNGTSFENAVWNQLLKIPTGTTASYAELAKGIENKNAVRAVGRANGKNCLAIIIPCHRVIGADGNLTGYGGGLWRKKWLLEHEREFSKQ